MKYLLEETQEGVRINCEVNSGKLNKFYIKEREKQGKYKKVQMSLRIYRIDIIIRYQY